MASRTADGHEGYRQIDDGYRADRSARLPASAPRSPPGRTAATVVLPGPLAPDVPAGQSLQPQLPHGLASPARANAPRALRDPLAHHSHIELRKRRRRLRHKRGQLLVGKWSRHGAMLPAPRSKPRPCEADHGNGAKSSSVTSSAVRRKPPPPSLQSHARSSIPAAPSGAACPAHRTANVVANRSVWRGDPIQAVPIAGRHTA